MSIETMTKLATTVLSANTASVTFSNIPQGYTDLKVVWSGRQSRNEYVAAYTLVQFNSSTSGYTYRTLQADVPGTPTSQTESGVGISTGIIIGFVSNNNNTANTFGSTEMYVSNYSSSNYKTVSGEGMSENNSSNTGVLMTAGLWSNTAAITSITLSPWVGSSFNWLTHSTFTLYGVKAARTAVGNSIKAVGGNISFDGTYVVHTFNTSGTFTPSDSLRVDYLVVAGGGSGGSGGVGGGGGGAGGMRCTVDGTGGSGSLETALSLTAQAYTVTVGAGAAGVTAAMGNNGTDSVFSTITSAGGGGGSNGGSTGAAGNSGGSGGGGAGRSGTVTGGAASPSGQGFAGGAGVGTAGSDGGGGGGGASQVGQQGQNPTGGAGGNGRATSISGSSVTYAGGGGGGSGGGSTMPAGGTGGGGQGGADAPGIAAGTAGTANTGGGGGGSRDMAVASKNGGSGVVVIRYRAVV
jgi:hypothetical protein